MSKYTAVQLRVPVRVTVLSNSTATAVVPTGAKSVGLGETSRQKSVDVEQLMQFVLPASL